jgi:5-methylcytosine-specific restriction protein A
MPLYACLDCGQPSTQERCQTHTAQHAANTREADTRRGTRIERGYDQKWRRNRARFLKANPACVDCGKPATVADHDPQSRRQLVAQQHPHPDAWEHLKPRCHNCHSQRTGIAQPGGWNKR